MPLKFEHDQFNYVDVYWKQTNRHMDKTSKVILVYTILGMINHLSTVHGIKNNRDEMKFIPIKTAIIRKTAGEWLARQVCLDGISMNRLAKSKFQAHAFSSMGLK